MTKGQEEKILQNACQGWRPELTSPGSISLCMIVRDEEALLPRCLESVQGIVDEIIIVDTGSTDRIVEIASSYGAKVFYYEWTDDFAAARNVSLSYAISGWILVLDADEALTQSFRSSVKEVLKNSNNFTAYMCTFEDHQGIDQGKFKESADICKKYIADFPMSFALNVLLGWLLHFLKEYEKFTEYITKATAINPTDPVAWTMSGRVYFGYQDYKAAISALEKAVSMSPQEAENYFYLGCALLEDNQFKRIKQAMQISIKLYLKNLNEVVRGSRQDRLRVIEGHLRDGWDYYYKINSDYPIFIGCFDQIASFLIDRSFVETEQHENLQVPVILTFAKKVFKPDEVTPETQAAIEVNH
ncbi:glycosyltransferase [Anthocerotibacter panamensis]|uniref:glycosyltransferase n=1 Tax=Anthocerotibacter panamensis TaxID=2857077 RepID=UPI001C4079CB|nr:glycosyltransferase [Anthocerotibacter panamensis]